MDINTKIEKTVPFNNSVETGLRILSILNESYPVSYDLQQLVYLDYLTIHSGDFDGSIESLHPAVPYRNGEILVRSSIIEKGLKLFISKGLIEKIFAVNGIEYKATENSTPFIETLEEDYFKELLIRASWVSSNFSNFSFEELKNILQPKLEDARNEFNIELLQ